MSGNDDEARRPGPRHGRRRAAALSDDERTLWGRVAASVTPLRQGRTRVPHVQTEAASAPGTQPYSRPAAQKKAKAPDLAGAAAKGAGAKAADASGAGAGRPARTLPSPKAAKGPPPAPALDRRQTRRIAAGRTEIEARLDLHGLTQQAAHDRLVGFLRSAAAQGLKTVLVITGKGGARPSQDESGWARVAEPGVLRRNVPRWLAEAPLREVVIGYQTAAIRHGGEGAFYVTLRRRHSP